MNHSQWTKWVTTILFLSFYITASAQAPIATTNAATGISSTGATLNGIVNANGASTTVTFEYGLTTSYGTTVTADQNLTVLSQYRHPLFSL